ncbi:MAG TPA: thiamine phosphate synthase, partial [Thermodesulfovibrionales bacterium]|nr:thiamine phosphate synthase [Thermodesulfovibrionales bacterium]
YLITDRRLFTDHFSLFTAVEEALKGGLEAVQLREKDLGTRDLLDMAYKMRDLTKMYKAELFINDRVDIALAVEADGVHLGRESIPPSAVRKTFQNKLKIAVSTHTLDEALEAEREGADFITLGPVYHTPSKIKYGEPVGIKTLRNIKAKISSPVFAIGGMKLDNVAEVKETGAYGIALISAILTAEHVKETTEEFLRLLK